MSLLRLVICPFGIWEIIPFNFFGLFNCDFFDSSITDKWHKLDDSPVVWVFSRHKSYMHIVNIIIKNITTKRRKTYDRASRTPSWLGWTHVLCKGSSIRCVTNGTTINKKHALFCVGTLSQNRTWLWQEHGVH